jgi:DNA polymerase-3 subunit alpha
MSDHPTPLLCVGTGRNLDDPKRFRFEGGGYYLKTAGDLRELWDGQVPGACDNTLLIAERVSSYETVFGQVDRMPEFSVAEGATLTRTSLISLLPGLAG